MKVRVSYQADPEHATERAAEGRRDEHLDPAPSAAGRRARQPRRPGARIQRARLPRRHQPLAGRRRPSCAPPSSRRCARKASTCRTLRRPRRPRDDAPRRWQARQHHDRCCARQRSRSGRRMRSPKRRDAAASRPTATTRAGRRSRTSATARSTSPSSVPLTDGVGTDDGRDGAAHAGGQDAARARHQPSPARSGRCACATSKGCARS